MGSNYERTRNQALTALIIGGTVLNLDRHGGSHGRDFPVADDAVCDTCGRLLEHAVEKEVGPHIGVYCRCGKWLAWKSKPLTSERARAFVMPYGRHKGQRLDEIPRDYLDWLAKDCQNAKIRSMAEIVGLDDL